MTVDAVAHSELERSVHERLGTIEDPCSVRNRTPLTLLEMGIVEDVSVDEHGHAKVTMLLTDPGCVFFFEMGREIKQVVADIPGIASVEVLSIGDRWWESDRMPAEARAKLKRMRAERDGNRPRVRLGRSVGEVESAPRR